MGTSLDQPSLLVHPEALGLSGCVTATLPSLLQEDGVRRFFYTSVRPASLMVIQVHGVLYRIKPQYCNITCLLVRGRCMEGA